jgi:hypothetical protein
MIVVGECKTMTKKNNKRTSCVCGRTHRPYFGESGNAVPTHCLKCKTKTMVNIVKQNMCRCGRYKPSFNEPGKTEPLYCFKFKNDTMVNVMYRKYNLYPKMNISPIKPTITYKPVESTVSSLLQAAK